jgi:pimeloyl-ACP methyl ester carboxylesterase
LTLEHTQRTFAFGRNSDPAVLLLMGNSAPVLVWLDAFCTLLAGAGTYVLRFDQRDTGLSSYVDYAAAPYTLDALAEDARGVLDGFGIARAHVVGLSQGGVLAYRLALRAPGRLISFATVMSSPRLHPKTNAFRGLPPEDGALPPPSPAYVRAVIALNAAPPKGSEAAAVRFMENFRLAAGARSPFDEAAWLALGRAVAERPLARRDGLTAAVANNSNHARAQAATPELSAADLAATHPPLLIIHGDGDPIFPPEHARWAANTIPEARLLMLEDMGHALAPAFFAPVATALTQFWREVAVQGQA